MFIINSTYKYLLKTHDYLACSKMKKKRYFSPVHFTVRLNINMNMYNVSVWQFYETKIQFRPSGFPLKTMNYCRAGNPWGPQTGPCRVYFKIGLAEATTEHTVPCTSMKDCSVKNPGTHPLLPLIKCNFIPCFYFSNRITFSENIGFHKPCYTMMWSKISKSTYQWYLLRSSVQSRQTPIVKKYTSSHKNPSLID